jgi:hypothetical protein
MGNQINDQLLARHEELTRETRLAHQQLVSSVEASLRTHLDETLSRSAETMVRMARETWAELRAQAETVNERLLAAHHDIFVRQQDQIQRSVIQIDAVVAQHLGQLGASLEAPLARLMEISSQAPKAAAEVIVELRQRINDSMARDNQLLQEREEIMSQLAKVSQSFTHQVQAQGGQLTDLAAQLQASAAEVGALAESFAAVAQSLIQSQQSTLDHLRQIEAALSQSMSRSDDQMAYYLKQAKEVIELSLSAQKPMIEALERVGNAAWVGGGKHAQ